MYSAVSKFQFVAYFLFLTGELVIDVYHYV